MSFVVGHAGRLFRYTCICISGAFITWLKSLHPSDRDRTHVDDCLPCLRDRHSLTHSLIRPVVFCGFSFFFPMRLVTSLVRPRPPVRVRAPLPLAIRLPFLLFCIEHCHVWLVRRSLTVTVPISVDEHPPRPILQRPRAPSTLGGNHKSCLRYTDSNKQV